MLLLELEDVLNECKETLDLNKMEFEPRDSSSSIFEMDDYDPKSLLIKESDIKKRIELVSSVYSEFKSKHSTKIPSKDTLKLYVFYKDKLETHFKDLYKITNINSLKSILDTELNKKLSTVYLDLRNKHISIVKEYKSNTFNHSLIKMTSNIFINPWFLDTYYYLAGKDRDYYDTLITISNYMELVINNKDTSIGSIESNIVQFVEKKIHNSSNYQMTIDHLKGELLKKELKQYFNDHDNITLGIILTRIKFIYVIQKIRRYLQNEIKISIKGTKKAGKTDFCRQLIQEKLIENNGDTVYPTTYYKYPYTIIDFPHIDSSNDDIKSLKQMIDWRSKYIDIEIFVIDAAKLTSEYINETESMKLCREEFGKSTRSFVVLLNKYDQAYQKSVDLTKNFLKNNKNLLPENILKTQISLMTENEREEYQNEDLITSLPKILEIRIKRAKERDYKIFDEIITYIEKFFKIQFQMNQNFNLYK